MRTFTFAVLVVLMTGWAGAQQVQLLENDLAAPEKAAAVSSDDTPQIIMPSEDKPAVAPKPAAEVKKPGPAAVKKAVKPATKKKTAKAEKPAAVKTAAPVKPAAAAPAVPPIKPAVVVAAPAATENFPSLEEIAATAKPAQEIKPSVQTKPVEAAKPAPAKAAAAPVAAVKPVEAAKPAPVKPAAAPVVAVKPAEAVKPAPVKPVPAVAVKPAAVPEIKKAAAVKKKPVSTPIPPAEPKPEGGFDVTKVHNVVKGDTLWDLSAKYYNDPYKWGRIYNANLNVVTNPDLINPKEELIIPEIMETVKPEPKKALVIGDGDTVKDADLTSVEVAQPEVAAAPVKTAAAELSEALDRFDRADLSEEMPEHQKEWAAGLKIVPEGWREDGVITAKEKGEDDSVDGSLSMSGDTMIISMTRSGLVKTGDRLVVYLKGSEAYDKDGEKLGLEVQAAGTLEVLETDGSRVRAMVIDAVTPISKGYVVKKK